VNGLVEGQQQANRAYPISVGVVGSRDEARVSSAWLARLAEEHGLSHGDKLKVPESIFTGCEEMQRGFLQALFTADGHVSGELAKGVSVRLTSISRELLVDVQRLLLNFGIASAIYSERRTEQVRELPDGKGGRASYECQAYYELVISKSNLACFAKEIGFLTAEKQAALQTRLQAYRRGPYHESFTATFAALVPEGEEPVFDLTEPTTHSFIANGLICHNCGEQGLPEWGVCNLGALNVAAFVQDGQLDYAALADHAKVAIRFLDNVIDANEYFIEENRQGQLGTRRTGLGTMGLADALIKLQVRYGSEESLQVIDQI
jgi:ribonucleoside-diphosphate reductase alpha chain